MESSDDFNEKKEDLFNEINEKIELWSDTNDDKLSNSDLEIQRKLMFSIFNHIKKENEPEKPNVSHLGWIGKKVNVENSLSS